jgi:hypothetical protein
MSLTGHSRRFWHFADMSVIQPISDKSETLPQVGDVPIGDIVARAPAAVVRDSKR